MSILDSITKPLGLGSSTQEKRLETQQEKEEALMKQHGAKEILLEWTRPSKISSMQLNPRFLRMFTIIAVVVGLILALMQELVVILVVGSLIFFYYALNKKYISADIKYQITNYGIVYGDTMYYWYDLKRFFYAKRMEEEILSVDTSLGLPARLIIVFPAELKDKITDILKQYLVYLEVEPKSFLDKIYEKTLSKLNFEDK